MKVCSFLEISEELGNTKEGKYLCRYLKKLEAKTVVIEDNYIDKDYLIDYSNFYARSFKPFEKKTKRLHFFNEDFSEEKFIGCFSLDVGSQDFIKEAYLGFVLVKPIEFGDNKKLIGRTLLQTYKTDTENGEKRKYTKFKHDVYLYGIKLEIESLPYQMQDQAVAACATTAIWTSLSALNFLFGTVKQSPFEITKTSVYFPGYERDFPNSGGLTIFQIKEYFNSTGLETESINVEKDPEVIPYAIKAHIDFGLPIIACICIINHETFVEEHHAVVISGYRSDKAGRVTEIYLHDDRIGPYCWTKSSDSNNTFSYWENDWLESSDYDTIRLDKLLIPIYPKIRYSFNKVYKTYLRLCQSLY